MAIAAADQDVRLNSDAEQFLDAVLSRLRFQFAGRRNEGHQREMHEDDVFRTKLEAHLANRFQKWQRFDVADRAADFDEHNVNSLGYFAKCGFDFVGNMRNYLNGFAEIVTTALFGDDGLVEATSGPVVVARQVRGSEALVVAEVEIRFGAVISDEHFSVLIRRHGAGINVQVGIALLEGDAKAAAFEQTAHRSRCYAFSERRNHATRHKNIFWGGPQGPSTSSRRICVQNIMKRNRASVKPRFRIAKIIFSSNDVATQVCALGILDGCFNTAAECAEKTKDQDWPAA